VKIKQMYESGFVGRIGQLWTESGMSVAKFADHCGVSRSSMQYYLDGDRNPDSVRIKKICDACSVSADWLLGTSDIRSLSVDAQIAVKYSGLPENMIERIRASYNENQIQALADLVDDEMFPHLLDDYSFFMLLLNNIKDYEQFTDVDSTEVTKEKKVVMSYSTAKSLIAAQVSNDLAEICRHREQETLMRLINSTQQGEEEQEF